MSRRETLAHYLGPKSAAIGHYETGARPLPADRVLRKWLKYLGWPVQRLEELRDARTLIELQHRLRKRGVAPEAHVRLHDAVLRDVLPLRPPDRRSR